MKYKNWLQKSVLYLFLPVCVLLATAGRSSQRYIPEPCNTDNGVFEIGEELVYKIYYNWNFMWLSAGEVTFRVYDDDDEYHLSARGRTYDSYEWFFTVNDNYDSYISKSTLLPRISIRDIQEGNYERYEKVTFNQGSHSARSVRGRSRSDATPQEFELDGCMHDILSILYYLRNVDLDGMQNGEEIPVKFFFDRETYPLSVKYLGTEDRTKVKGMGHYRTHKLSPELIAGEVFKEGDEMMVWVSRDENKIPILIESPVSVGSVKVVLKSYKGLKYDFTAKR